MYGKWFLVTFGPIAVILLIIALAVTPWAAIFAVAIALVLGTMIVWGRATRRTEQLGSEHAAVARDRAQAREGAPAGEPSGARGAPESGEGGVGDAHAAPQVRDRA
jgi:hypothetical protein